MRRAVIDIGTNTVKLLVADCTSDGVVPLIAMDETTRLGEGVNQAGRFQPAAMARTVAAIARYLREARAGGATSITALATSAARDAANRDEFVALVRQRCGLTVELVSGEREAALVFRGVQGDPRFAGNPLTVLDVGGGSAELIQGGPPGTIDRLVSLPLGAVRLTEQFGEAAFPALCEHIRHALRDALTGFVRHGRRLVGTGGTLVTLAAIDHVARHGVRAEFDRDIDHHFFTAESLRAVVLHLHALPLVERQRVPGLPPERADIIVAGGMVFVLALEALAAAQIIVSVRNLRYGALAR